MNKTHNNHKKFQSLCDKIYSHTVYELLNVIRSICDFNFIRIGQFGPRIYALVCVRALHFYEGYYDGVRLYLCW